MPSTLRCSCELFVTWVEGLRDGEPDIVAIDGKTSRRARSGEGHPLHVVSAWTSRRRLVPGQQATAEKSNGIIAFPLLPARLQLTGARVAIDAMGTRTKIAHDLPKRAVPDRGADCLPAPEDNHKSLADEVARFFDSSDGRARPAFETVDADRGRTETRRHGVGHDAG